MTGGPGREPVRDGDRHGPEPARDLVIGVGMRPGADPRALIALVETALARAGLSPRRVRALATVDVRGDEPAVRLLAARWGWPLVTHPAARLATVDVVDPSARTRAALGTPSVAEAACLLGDGVPEDVTAPEAVTAAAAQAAGEIPVDVDPQVPVHLDMEVELLVAKRANRVATVAVARHRPRSRSAS